MVPEKLVRCAAMISNIVEKHVQLFVIVEVGDNDSANGRGSSKATTGYVLQKSTPQGFNSSKLTASERT